MKLLFSEAAPDYEHYIFPYAVWAFPEPGESPADLFEAGFLPSTRELSRFYRTRHIRIRLGQFAPSSENRRILRKCSGVAMKVLPKGEFALTAERREFCQRYADARFGEGIMSETKLDTLFSAPVATHIMVFEEGNRELGYVVLYLEGARAAFFYYSFYDLTFLERSLGLYIMTSAVQYFAATNFEYLYLGTCYNERALYKTQFGGCEFFTGFRWSNDIKELKHLVARQSRLVKQHLLEDTDYLGAFYRADEHRLADDFGVSVKLPVPNT